MAEFEGFGADLREFFDGLERDNSKAYFDAHRELYQRAVRKPCEALIAELEPRYGGGRVFRLNRDVRFAADKRPYHTNLGVEFAGSGAHYYMSISADELVASVGVFRAAKEWVDRFREAAAGPAGDELLVIVRALESHGYLIGGEELKTVPRGYPADHRNARLLRHKSLTASRRWPASAWSGRPDTMDLIVGAWERAAGLSRWLSAHTPIGD
jgi:uncharacterized protein (TIGR02453 family)